MRSKRGRAGYMATSSAGVRHVRWQAGRGLRLAHQFVWRVPNTWRGKLALRGNHLELLGQIVHI